MKFNFIDFNSQDLKYYKGSSNEMSLFEDLADKLTKVKATTKELFDDLQSLGLRLNSKDDPEAEIVADLATTALKVSNGIESVVQQLEINQVNFMTLINKLTFYFHNFYTLTLGC